MKYRFIYTLLFLSLFVLGGVSHLAAADWYVDNEASGSRNGTSWKDAWTSFSSIRWGSGGVQPGDTLYISGGSQEKVYREQLKVGIDGTESRRITIRPGQSAGHSGMVVIDGQYRIGVGVLLADYVTLDGNSGGKIGMKIKNMEAKGISSDFQQLTQGIRISFVELENNGTEKAGSTRPGYAHGIHLQNVRDTEISYTHIYGSYKDGINLGGSRGSWGSNKIHHNHIHDCGDDGVTGSNGMDVYSNLIHDLTNFNAGHPDGVQILGNYTRIYNNVVYNAANSQIFWDSLEAGGPAAHARIYNNLVYLTRPEIGRYVRGIAVKAERGTTGVDDLVIANNTVVDQSYFGIGIAANNGSLTNTIVKNNVVYNSGINSSDAITLYDYSRSSSVHIDYNQVHQGRSGNNRIIFGGAFVQAHGIDREPEFQSYAEWSKNNDLRPSGGAVTIYGDDMSQYFTTDLSGAARRTWTVGCYTSSGSGIAPAQPAQIVPESAESDEPAGSGTDKAPSAPQGFRIK